MIITVLKVPRCEKELRKKKVSHVQDSVLRLLMGIEDLCYLGLRSSRAELRGFFIVLETFVKSSFSM